MGLFWSKNYLHIVLDGAPFKIKLIKLLVKLNTKQIYKFYS